MRQLLAFLLSYEYVKDTVHWEGVTDRKWKVAFDVFI